ncbi:hypothetical protein [Mycolicibacterium phlei]
MDRVVGDTTGLAFPAHIAALRDAGPAFLTEAFRAYGALALQEVAGGSTGRKALLTVHYSTPGAPAELFVKFSRDFDHPARDVGRHQMEPEVRFAALSRAEGFPIAGPTTLFADYHRESGTGLMISERIAFGTGKIEPQYAKCLDDEMPDQRGHYRALLSAVARLAGAQRRLPADLVGQFPVDLQAATVGEKPRYTAEQIDRRLTHLGEFVTTHPGLFSANVRSQSFVSRLRAEGAELLRREDRVWRLLAADDDYLALCHWNANVDNAWFWRDDDGVLRCGLMDWGCVSRMNVAMAIWGSLSGAETTLWDVHLDELLTMFCDEVAAGGGPVLDPAVVSRHLVLYATLMGLTWLLDVPALIRRRLPDAGPLTTRLDPRIRAAEAVRAPLQMMTNVLNVWQTRGLAEAMAGL